AASPAPKAWRQCPHLRGIAIREPTIADYPAGGHYDRFGCCNCGSRFSFRSRAKAHLAGHHEVVAAVQSMPSVQARPWQRGAGKMRAGLHPRRLAPYNLPPLLRSFRMGRIQTWVVASCLAAVAGCQSAPGLLNPGPAEYQQHVSNQFDPYPSVEDGPPVVGGRPIDYQQPYTE